MKIVHQVQHVSGTGHIWDVVDITRDNADVWCAQNGPTVCMLPRSEYRIIDPPEVWENVSEHIEPSPVNGNWRNAQNGDTALGVSEPDYRLRKVTLCDVHQFTPGGMNAQITAFIVERRKV